jgi:hypothetical protein
MGMDMRETETHCKGDACAGLGDRMIVGMRSVDVRVVPRAAAPPQSHVRS